MMRKRIISFILILAVILSLTVLSFASGKEEHDKILEHVLFGSESYKQTLKQDSKQYLALVELENAVAICLDQYQGNYTDNLSMLNSHKIHGLPKDISAIDFSSNSHHRRYTHRGWNMNYREDDRGHWEIRKTILLQTVNHVFGFQEKAGIWESLGKTTDYGYSEKCDAFAAFLYYIHVLGEYSEANKKNNIIGDTIPLVRLNPREDNEDIFFELKRILPIILESAERKGDIAYSGLMHDLKRLHIVGQALEKAGGMNDDNFSDYKELCKKLLEKLYRKMPDLLRDEPFFKESFY